MGRTIMRSIKSNMNIIFPIVTHFPLIENGEVFEAQETGVVRIFYYR